MFSGTRIVEAAFPELLVAAGVAGANLLTRAMDVKAGRETTLTKVNTWTHVGIMGGSMIAVGYNKWPEMAKAAIIADFVPLSDRILSPLVEQAVGVKLQPAGAVLAPHFQPRVPSRDRTPVLNPVGPGARIERSYQPEFQQANAF